MSASTTEAGAETPSPPRRWLGRFGPAAGSGLLAAGAALGVAELVASFVSSTASPLVAVGGTFVDATPRWLKEFAIRTFGDQDKTVLLLGIIATIALISMGIGVLALHRLRLGVVAVLGLGLVPAAAAATRPTGSWVDAVPALVGAAVGAGCLRYLIGCLTSGTTGRDEIEQTTPSIARRSFLRASLVVGTVAAVSGVLGRFVLGDRLDVEKLRSALKLPLPAEPAPSLSPNVRLDVRGVTPFYTSNSDFYRVDTALVVPAVNSDDWSLRVHGMVDSELRFSLDDLLARPLMERDVTLTCVSNEVGGALVGTARWLGVRVQDLLEEAGVSDQADQIVSRSHDGMTIGTPTAALLDGRDALLAVGMNGEPLPLEHGFPVRMVVPGLYGYVSACKWIVEMEATTFSAYDPLLGRTRVGRAGTHQDLIQDRHPETTGPPRPRGHCRSWCRLGTAARYRGGRGAGRRRAMEQGPSGGERRHRHLAAVDVDLERFGSGKPHPRSAGH